jgi:hypothetical protein
MMSRVLILSGALLPSVVSVPLVALICLLLYSGDVLSAQLSARAPLGASSPQLLASRGKHNYPLPRTNNVQNMAIAYDHE